MNLKGRSLLALNDFSVEEIRLMLDTARDLKKQKQSGTPHRLHEGKTIALLFEKTSTRTRCAFEVAAADLGMTTTFLGIDDIQFGQKESTQDTALVLGRMYDGLGFRGFNQSTVETLARYAGVPVWNGLTDDLHPTQVLADFMTIEEHIGTLPGTKLVYIGDGRNNMANSLLLGCAQMGVNFVIAAPQSLHPDIALVEQAQRDSALTGATIEVTTDLMSAVEGAQALYTDVWVSMGEEDEFAQRVAALRDYQVTMDVINATGNPDVIFLHCLPAFHDTKTAIGEQVEKDFGLTCMEVTDEVFQSSHSVVFDQAENRLHTIKAVMALTL